ncbi:MAG: DUF2147 domain-containing protein [Chitinophagales bacterium]|nr:DUF2147 domain-containing protein [Bacteroidota bacterium]MBP8916721.1 DUF2147 domain-containing protein [Chitinophagales bacterium]MBP9221653.1 DUF2147 domain-containing protein [Chitinophagales bacterium]MBP9795747.1 DUF2147 domain-containing protein [Chitinophagales bacterium]
MKLFISSLFFLLMHPDAKTQGNADAVIGKWKSDNGRLIVEIYKSGNKYYGKIDWIYIQTDSETGKPRTDIENPDKSKRNVPLIGLVVLKNFEFKDGFWQNGTVYNSQNGNTYDCEFWMEGKNKLVLRGYWGFVYHTEYWTRTE